MIDLHCHVLPGIDDGPAEIEESVLLCRLAAAQGTDVLVATPHQHHPLWWNQDRAELERLRGELQRRLGEKPLLLPGAEIRVDSTLLEEVEKLPGGGLQPLADSSYLLLELDRRGMGPDPAEIVHEVVVAGWRPIIAHPEMYSWFMQDPSLRRRLASLGAMFQVTAMSVTGDFGRFAQANCHRLLDEGLVHFVASDTHSVDARPPGLARAFAAIAGGWGEEMARALTSDNPQAVIENRSLRRPVYA